MISKKKLQVWNQSSGGIYFLEELEMFERDYKDNGLSDVVRMRGFLSIVEYPADDDGSPIKEKGRVLEANKNLIVNVGRASLASLQRTTAAGLTTIGVFDLGLLAVGDGSSGGSSVPQPSDTGLANERTDPVGGPVVSGVTRPTLSVSTPAPSPFTTNLWSAQIGTTQLNGVDIDEAALFCLDDATMFSYRTFAAQTKASGFVLEFRWSILM